jgi:hypothetical protein
VPAVNRGTRKPIFFYSVCNFWYNDNVNFVLQGIEMVIKLTVEEIDEIQEYISKNTCPFDFKCYKSGLEDVSSVMVDLRGNIIECLDENAKQCQRSLPFGSDHLCTCPLRRYIAKHFGK